MKALILSLVIAFSSSFAMACTQASGNWGNKEGAYTKANKAAPVRVGNSHSSTTALK